MSPERKWSTLGILYGIRQTNESCNEINVSFHRRTKGLILLKEKEKKKKTWEEAEKILLMELNNAVEEERKLIPRHLIV